MNKLMRLGLVGLISLGIAGNALASEFMNIAVKNLKEKRKEVTELDTRYNIKNISQNEGNIIVNVETEQKRWEREVKVFLEEVYRCEFQKIRTIVPGIHKGINLLSKEKLSEEIIEETGKDYDRHNYWDKPAENLEVTIKNLEGGIEFDGYTKKTDSQGRVIFNIKSYPNFWNFNEHSLRLSILETLQNYIADDDLISKISDSVQVYNKDYKVEIKTTDTSTKESGIWHYKKNDEKKFNVKGKSYSFNDITKYLIDFLKQDVRKGYPPITIAIKVKDAESHSSIEGSIIHLRAKKLLTIEQVETDFENIKRKYLKKNVNSDFYRQIKIDCSDILVNLDGIEERVREDGMYITATKGSIYGIEVTHPDYPFFNGEINFNREQNKTVYLDKPGQKVRLGIGIKRNKMVDE